MNLTEHQKARLELLAKSEHGQFLHDLLGGYILEIKDECVLGELPKEAAKTAVTKFEALREKLLILSGQKKAEERTRFH